MIYTTNAIESYNSQLRKVLKGKGAFPNETSVMKLIYLQTMGALAENEVNDPQLLGYGCPGRERSEQSSTTRVWVPWQRTK